MKLSNNNNCCFIPYKENIYQACIGLRDIGLHVERRQNL